jgi:hypothetical protein
MMVSNIVLLRVAPVAMANTMSRVIMAVITVVIMVVIMALTLGMGMNMVRTTAIITSTDIEHESSKMWMDAALVV